MEFHKQSVDCKIKSSSTQFPEKHFRTNGDEIATKTYEFYQRFVVSFLILSNLENFERRTNNYFLTIFGV